jgi:hypothetical protein
MLAGALPAQAARPLNTDDAGVLDRGACELELARGRETAEGERSTGTGLQLGCGVGAGTQLALGVDRTRAAGERSRGTTLSAKTALRPGDDAGWSLGAALAWASEPGRGQRHAGTELALLHTRSLGDAFTLHANLGHARDEITGRRSTPWGLALEHAGWGPVAAMAEVFGDDRERPAWNAGLRWTALPERLFLDVAYGRQLRSGGPRALSFGAKLGF